MTRLVDEILREELQQKGRLREMIKGVEIEGETAWRACGVSEVEKICLGNKW